MSDDPELPDRVADGLRRARAHLLGRQHPQGWWKGELQTNVTMDAEDLLLREFLGVRTPSETRDAALWIRGQQRDDGTWATFHGGPGDLSTTVEAYLALRLAGDVPDAPHMRAASVFVRARGGLESTRVFTRIWCALFGLWPWDRLPALPPEMIFLPSSLPLNIYDFACWARQTLVALTVVSAHRPVRPLPFDLAELSAGLPPDAVPPLWSRRGRTWESVFLRLDGALHVYERRPLPGLRELALQRAERWILDRQEADGSWGGIQPPWVYSLMALHLRGYELDHPVLRKGLQGLDAFTITDERGRRLEACQSPVWDTALAVVALSDAGLSPHDPALRRAGAWLLGEEVQVSGDWAVRRPDLTPGGWAFEFENDVYPDIDDTAEVVIALRRLQLADAVDSPDPLTRPGRDPEEAVRRGVDWVLGMRSAGGAWGAFDADNTRTLCTRLPFCDFGEVIDPPSADVTAHVVEMLTGEGLASGPEAREAVAWLLDEQEVEGSWFGRWGVNHLYGTGAAVPALVQAGIPVTHPAVRRAVSWLTSVQNDDGGWGEDPRSYIDHGWRGRGTSTASQTAWALMALLAAGESSDVVRRGVAWLVATQREDGGWDEPWFTGTGFPWDFSINYGLYRVVFPVTALGRYLGQCR